MDLNIWNYVGIGLVLLVVALWGGHIRKLTKEMKELVGAVKEFLEAVDSAIVDDNITAEEWSHITADGRLVVSEAKDVGGVIAGICQMVAGFIARKGAR